MNSIRVMLLVFYSVSVFSCISTSKEYLIKNGTLRREFNVSKNYTTVFNILSKKISDCAIIPFTSPLQPKRGVDLSLNEEKKIGTIDYFMESFGKKSFFVAIEVENKDQKNSTVRILAAASVWNDFADRISEWAKGEKTECQ